MTDFLQDIRTHFNILIDQDSLSLTLINPNITAQIMNSIKNNLTLISNLISIDIVIIECPNFDDELLTILAKGLPRSLKELSLDFTGCESLRGQGFLELFQNLDGLQLTKLSLDFGSLLDINDIVVQGLTLLLSNLTQSLQQFYLDLYEVDQITQEGYLILAQAITELNNLTKIHIDLSANQYLTEDSLQILFSGNYQRLKSFSLKILDTQQIGGGSFFKLSQSLGKMPILEELSLTISTFSNINHKGTYSILRSIGKIPNLKKLDLNFSNIQIPQKVLTYLTICPSLQQLNLDISCNRKVTFGDILNLATKIKKVKKIELNLDFCSNITEDVVQQILTIICTENKCISLALNDRSFSPQFQSNIIPILMESKALMQFSISGTKISKKFKIFQDMMKKKRFLLWIAINAQAKNHSPFLAKSIMEQVFYSD